LALRSNRADCSVVVKFSRYSQRIHICEKYKVRNFLGIRKEYIYVSHIYFIYVRNVRNRFETCSGHSATIEQTLVECSRHA